MIKKMEIDEQKIFFGSSEKMAEIPAGTVDFTMTSPPYWNLKDYEHRDQIGHEDYEQYLERMNMVWRECFRVSKDNGILVVNVNSRRHSKVLYPIAFDIHRTMKDWKLIDILIWYIPNALPQPNHYIEKLFDNKFEFILVYGKNHDYKYTFNKVRVKQKYLGIDPRTEKLNSKGRCIGNIIRIPAYRPPTIKKQNYHIAAYPEELVYLLMHTYSNKGDTVLDPFLGSGTTLKVARTLGRSGYGYELNDEYAPVIEARIKELWQPPAFESLDIIHSSTTKPGMAGKKRRDTEQYKSGQEKINLFSLLGAGLKT